MSDSIICVRDLGKQYRIGTRPGHGLTLGETLSNAWHEMRRAVRGEPRDETATIWAVRDVSFDVEPGEVLGIIGRNGAGKSTLLKILSRVTRPTTGYVELYGRAASLLEVGTGFHPELSGRENIYLNGVILGMTHQEITRQFDAIVDFSEIEQFLDTPVKRYSSGMFVRLAFAVAAHLQPEILIVDEVLSVGDRAFQKKCLGTMDEAAKGGRTVLFVSHNLEAVRRLCGRCMLLDAGRLQSVGSTENVIHEYVAQGASSTAEHFIPAPRERGPAWVSSLRLEKRDGTPAAHFAAGDSWIARLCLHVDRPAEELTVALGVRTETEFAIHTTWHTRDYSESGDYEVTFISSALSLAPGRYLFSIGVSRRGLSLQYTDDGGTLEIAGVGPELSATGYHPGAGVVLTPFEVEVRRVGG